VKKYKWYLVGGAVVLLVAIIIGVSVGKGGDDPPGPGPDPPLPPGPAPEGFNPYSLDEDSFEDGNSVISGRLSASS
jgi:hypothetical protein